MHRFLLFLVFILAVGLTLQSCQNESALPIQSPQASAGFDPDQDEYLKGQIAGPEGCRGKIGNWVWFDEDCDGIQDCMNSQSPEYGIPGVVVNLIDPVTGNLIATTVTDSTGRYKFVRLCAGEYLVEVIPPDGYVLTTPFQGGNDMKDSNPNPYLVVLGVDEINKSVDFGFCMRVGGEGCTPGYWKQEQHFDSWPSPYYPEMQFSDVFEDAFPGQTLLDVVSTGGGGLEALGRHAVAALLNGASDGVSYDLTADQVIDMFNDIYPGTEDEYEALKDIFANYNEQGCPLD
jgi:hypothetical protein